MWYSRAVCQFHKTLLPPLHIGLHNVKCRKISLWEHHARKCNKKDSSMLFKPRHTCVRVLVLHQSHWIAKVVRSAERKSFLVLENFVSPDFHWAVSESQYALSMCSTSSPVSGSNHSRAFRMKCRRSHLLRKERALEAHSTLPYRLNSSTDRKDFLACKESS